MPVPAKTHMKVKCHWSAPPSHPPKVRAFGMSTRFFCGTLGPTLGKARKIRSPLVTRTKTETAFSQWQKRTTQGCSNAARTLPFGFSAKPAGTSTAWLGPAGSAGSGASMPPAVGPRIESPAGFFPSGLSFRSLGSSTALPCSAGLQPGSLSEPRKPTVAQVRPVGAMVRLEDIGNFERREVLRRLVSQLGRQRQAQRRAVAAIERLAVHLVAEQGIRVQRCGHVQGLVVVVGALEGQEARGRVRPYARQEVADSHAAETADHVPALHAHV